MGASSSTPEENPSAKLLDIAPSTGAAAATRGGSSSSSSSSSQRKATQCVCLAKGAGTALNKHFPSKKPLNLITIWGKARTGKSFFMNALITPESDDNNNTGSDKDVFAVAGGPRPCTVGASISTTTRSLEQISSASSPPPPPVASSGGRGSWWWGSSSDQASTGASQPQQLPDIGFVDVEGQGDNGDSYDTKLVAPLLLLSKVVIYNWQGLPNRATTLDKLSAMTYAASLLSPEEREDSFGHLIILLRDVSSTQEQSAYDRIFEQEDETVPDTPARDALKERNEKRKLLQQSFQSTRVCCLPRPHHAINGEREIPQAEVSAEFTEKVSELRRKLATDLLVEPHRFGNRPIEGGVALATLLTKVCEAVNEGSAGIVPLSMMESVHVERAEGAYEESKEVFLSTLSQLGVGRPKSEADTRKLLDKAGSTAVEWYTRETQGLARAAVDRGGEMLDLAIAQRAGECYDRQKDQVDAAQAEVDRLIDEAQTRHIDQQLVTIRRGLPMRKGQVKSAWNGMCTKLHNKLQGDVVKKVDAYKDLCGDLPRKLPTLTAFKSSVQGKLDLLLTENDRLAAERAEAERIERAIQLERERQASLQARLRQEEEETQMLWEEAHRQRGRGRGRRGHSSSSRARYGYDHTLSPSPTRWDTLSPPHDRRTRLNTLSPPRDRGTRYYDNTLSPPRDRRTRWDTLSPPPDRGTRYYDNTVSPPRDRRTRCDTLETCSICPGCSICRGGRSRRASPPPAQYDPPPPSRHRAGVREGTSAAAAAAAVTAAAAATRSRRTHDVHVGPIWNQADAERKAREYIAEHPDQEWTGQWTTTSEGEASVIGVRDKA